MSWKGYTTGQKIAAIRAAQMAGYGTCGQIGRFIGVSRNAVIGMYHRYPTLLQDVPLKGPRPSRRVKERKSEVVEQVKEKPAKAAPIARIFTQRNAPRSDTVVPLPVFYPPADAPEPLNIGLMEFTASTCKWAVNDAAKGDAHLFCGHPTLEGKSWCEHHYRRSVGSTPSERGAIRHGRRFAA